MFLFQTKMATSNQSVGIKIEDKLASISANILNKTKSPKVILYEKKEGLTQAVIETDEKKYTVAAYPDRRGDLTVYMRPKGTDSKDKGVVSTFIINSHGRLVGGGKFAANETPTKKEVTFSDDGHITGPENMAWIQKKAVEAINDIFGVYNKK